MSVNTVFVFFVFVFVQNNKTPLHYAAEEGHLGVVTKLLESGADMGVKTWVRRLLLWNEIYVLHWDKNQSQFEFLFSWLIDAIY